MNFLLIPHWKSIVMYIRYKKTSRIFNKSYKNIMYNIYGVAVNNFLPTKKKSNADAGLLKGKTAGSHL